MKLSSVRLYVRLSHHSAAAAGLLLWARLPEDIDQLLHGPALGSKSEQCHVVSCRRKLNTDLQLCFESSI